MLEIKNDIISIIITINLLASTTLSENIFLLYSKITIKIDKPITNAYILGAFFRGGRPDYLYINNESKTFSNKYSFYNPNNTIVLIWNEEITDCNGMFDECIGFTEMDLSEFDTSKVTDMSGMFRECTSLTYLDLSNFNTSLVTSMSEMFKECTSLTTINLSSFNTSKVNIMSNMFSYCKNLTSLDLSHFDTSKISYLKEMFFNCTKLQYINLQKAKLRTIDDEYLNYIFDQTSQYLIFCSNETQIIKKFSDRIQIVNCTNNNIEFQCYRKRLNRMIYNNDTLCEFCGKNYYSYNNESSTNCIQIKEEDYHFNNSNKNTYNAYETDNTYINHESSNIIKESHHSDYIFNSNNSDKSEYNKTEIIMNIIESLINNFNITKTNMFEDEEEEESKMLILLTSTYNQKNKEYNNRTTVDLKECENELKENYNISYNDSLYMIIIEVKEEGMKIPKVEYMVYYPLKNYKLKLLNLSICKNKKAEISIPVSLTEDINMHNQSSDYYNNICSKAKSESGTDISIKDRKKIFIDENLTLCEENCDLIEYNYTTERAKCSCFIKIKFPLIDEIKIDKNKLYESFTDINNIANIKFLKCYKNVLKFKNLLKNYGFFIFISIFIMYVINIILFYSKYYFILQSQIYEISKAKKELKDTKITQDENNINTSDKENNKISEINHLEKKSFPPKKKEGRNIDQKNNIILNCIDINNMVFNSGNKIIKRKKKRQKKKKKKIRSINLNLSEKNKQLNIIKYKEIMNYNSTELNSLLYKKAIINDKRSFTEYYFSLLKSGNLLLFAFYCKNNDYNSQIIKYFLFFFFFAVHFTINTLFFNDNTMHQIYEDKGSFNLIYQIPQILYSSLISAVINTLIKYLSLTEKNILDFKREKKVNEIDNITNKLLKALKIKFILFFILTILLLSFFQFYVSCFCGIYINTQLHLIKDSVTSFALSLIYPFGIYLVPSIFRILSLRAEKKDKECMYKFSQLLQNI